MKKFIIGQPVWVVNEDFSISVWYVAYVIEVTLPTHLKYWDSDYSKPIVERKYVYKDKLNTNNPRILFDNPNGSHFNWGSASVTNKFATEKQAIAYRKQILNKV